MANPHATAEELKDEARKAADDVRRHARDAADDLGRHARKAADESERSFLHRGIATRAFERRFALADHVRVTGATHELGMLHIDLAREIPEAMKPRRIEISGPTHSETPAIEAQAGQVN